MSQPAVVASSRVKYLCSQAALWKSGHFIESFLAALRWLLCSALLPLASTKQAFVLVCLPRSVPPSEEGELKVRRKSSRIVMSLLLAIMHLYLCSRSGEKTSSDITFFIRIKCIFSFSTWKYQNVVCLLHGFHILAVFWLENVFWC